MVNHFSIFLINTAHSLHRSSLLGHGPRTTFNAGAGIRSGYVRGAGFVAFLTMLYPICWGCSEGGNVISPTGEMIWYGILDLLLGPVFLYYFVWGLRNVDYGLWGFNSGKYTDGPYGVTGAGGLGGAGYGGNAAGYGEKPVAGGTANAAPVGANNAPVAAV